MGEVLVIDRPAPAGVVELGADELAELAEQQSEASLRLMLPSSVLEVRLDLDEASVEDDDPTSLPDHLAREEYQRSLEAYRTLGALILKDELATEEGHIAKEALRRMWVTSLAEILENDEEFRGFFEINDHYEYEVQDGKVMAAPDKPMVDLVRDGARKSRAEAVSDPRMATQANRDDADVFNAERVDDMAAGSAPANTRFVVSKSPRNVMAADPDFWKGKGYRDGLAFGQLYYLEGRTLVAGTFSIDNVDDAVFDQVLGEYGVHVPGDRTSDYAVLDGVERNFDSRDQALAFAREFRARCYQVQGDTRHRQSVNEFMSARAARIDAAFNALCLPLSESVESTVRHETIRTFATGLLEAEENLKPEVVDQLQTICATETFTDADGRLLAGLTLYAVAEELYGDARRLLKGETEASAEPTALDYASEDELAAHLAGRVRTGVEAGRQHGGACAGVTDVSNKDGKEKKENEDPDNPQGAYGGRGQGEDNKPPKQIRCIKCHKYSPREKVVRIDPTKPDEGYWGCPHCRYKIDVCTGKVLHESSVDDAEGGLWSRLLALANDKEKQAKSSQN